MMFPELEIGNLESKSCIFQGGMSIGVSLDGLSSAVARAGGIGVIGSAACGFAEKDFYKNPKQATRRALNQYIKKAKKNSQGGIIGVNHMGILQDHDEMVKIIAEAGADLIISGAVLPLKLPGLIPEGCEIKLVPIVSSARAAILICKKWLNSYGRIPDAVVVEGPKAGGHLGFKVEELTLSSIVLERVVLETIKALKPFGDKIGHPVPVIAAGGIYSGSDVYKFLQLGATGVQMGTRFVATHECDAADPFKQAYVDAKEGDIAIIQSPVGLPGRVLKGVFVDKIKAGKTKPVRCKYRCIRTCKPQETPYCIAEALINAQRGNLEEGFVFCGANVHKIKKIISVKELFAELLVEYEETKKK